MERRKPEELAGRTHGDKVLVMLKGYREPTVVSVRTMLNQTHVMLLGFGGVRHKDLSEILAWWELPSYDDLL